MTLTRSVAVVVIPAWGLLSCFVMLVHAAPSVMPRYLPPMPFHGLLQSRSNHTDPTPEIFLEQMENPSEIFSVLLLIGGDIVQKAIAQLAGGRVTLVSFSFGWVAYAFNALMAAFGDGQIMPLPDYPAVVITAGSGIRKANNSWILGRLIRDLEFEVEKTFKKWVEEEVGEQGEKPVKRQADEGESGMLVTVYTAMATSDKQHWDKCWYLYFPALVAQLVIAAVPVIRNRNWSILFLTAVGTVLSIVTGSLREWRLQKYSCRYKTNSKYILTRGNGHRHVFVILPGEGRCPRLEDLAGAQRRADLRTRVFSVILAFLWLGFLITAGGLKSDAWFLLAVGGLGMGQNIIVAGLSRSPAAHGIPLKEHPATFGRRKEGKDRPKTMKVLFEIENYKEHDFGGIGLAIRREYFPDYALREDEVKDWQDIEDRLKSAAMEKKRAKALKENRKE